MTEADLERLAQRVAEIVLSKLTGRSCAAPANDVKRAPRRPTPEAIAYVQSLNKRLGRSQE